MSREAFGGGGPRNLPLSAVYRAGDFVFASGQVGFGPDGKLVEGGIVAETRQTLDNLAAVLAEAGCTLSDVVKATIWLANLNDFAAFNGVYTTYFPLNPPARSTVEAGLMIGAHVEIEVVAYRPRTPA